jgi:adenylate cyclase
MAETRKLAAIFAADEERTLARLRALRSDLIDPTIAVQNGRMVQRSGDGSLSSSEASSTTRTRPSQW